MRHPSRLFFCVGRHVVDPDKPAEGENLRNFPKFSVEAFLPSQIEGCEAHGHMREVKPEKLWEVQSPSTFRDAWWLSDDPEAKLKGNTSLLYLRWRLSRYLKTPFVELRAQSSPFDVCTAFFRRQNPCWAEAGPTADDLRTKLMASIHQLHQANPALARSIVEHFNRRSDSYTPGLVVAAIQGERKYGHDPLIESLLNEEEISGFSDGIVHSDPTPREVEEAISEDPVDASPDEPTAEEIMAALPGDSEETTSPEDPTAEEIMAALPGEPTGNLPPAVEAVRERTERRK